MAKIQGITIELGADASGIESALKGVNSTLKTTQSNLRSIDKLLKLDPGNTELLTQKQKNLKTAIEETKKKLETLKEAQSQVAEGSAEWDAIQREIIATEQQLEGLEKEYKNFGSVTKQQVIAAGESMKTFGNKVTEVGEKLSKLSGVAAGVLTSLAGITYKSMQSADEINTLSKQTGISTDSLQKWKYAADLVDVSFEDMTGAVSKLKKSMTGHSDTWDKLGVSVTDSSGNMRDAEDVFYDTIEALSKVENETERDQLAMDLFGKSADELAGIIDDGGASLKEYGTEAENLGLILSGDTLTALNDANDTVDKLKANFSGTFAQLGATLLETFGPALEKVAAFLGQVTEKIRELTPEQAEMIVKILAVIAVIGPLVTVIGSIITGVGSLITVLPLLAGPVGIVIAIIAALIVIGVELYKHWDELKEWASTTWEAIKTTISNVVDGIKTKVTSTWDNIKTKVVASVTLLVGAVTTAWNGIKTAVTTVVDNIKSKIDTLKDKFDQLKTKAQNIVDKIKSIFSGTISFPHIRLPHFTVYGGVAPYGIGGSGSMPKISVEWYKKAYDNPVLFSSPTVLPTLGGMKGFGDGHGAEIVMGLDKLREMVGASSGSVVINVYPSAGMNESQLASMVQDKLVQWQKQKEAAYA